MTQHLTAEIEASQVQSIYQSNDLTNLSIDQIWCPINQQFVNEWTKYTGFDFLTIRTSVGQSTRPSVFDQSLLLDQKINQSVNVLKVGLVEQNDFTLVPKQVADLLYQWYDESQPRFDRRVIQRGKSMTIDLYPTFVRLIELDENGQPINQNQSTDQAVQCLASNESFYSLFTRLSQSEKMDTSDTQQEGEVSDEYPVPQIRLFIDRTPSAPSIDQSSNQSISSQSIPFDSQCSVLKGGESSFDQSTSQSTGSSVDRFSLLTFDEMLVPVESLNLDRVIDCLVDRRKPNGEWSVNTSISPKDSRDFSVGDQVDLSIEQDDMFSNDLVWTIATVREVLPGKILVSHSSSQSSYQPIGTPVQQTEESVARYDIHRLAPLNTHTQPISQSTGQSADQPTDDDDDDFLPFSSLRTNPATSRSLNQSSYSFNQSEPGHPSPRGAVGFRNLGNTCFMNSVLQCMMHNPSIISYFWGNQATEHINRSNALGWGGRIADEFINLVKSYWSNKFSVISPRAFKDTLGEFQPRFSGYQQHDSSELLAFLIDGLHEDLNRVVNKPYTQAVEAAGKPDHVVAAEAWQQYKLRNDSIITDRLMGQLKSKLVCPDPACANESITFDPYCMLSLPLPAVNDQVQLVRVVYSSQSINQSTEQSTEHTTRPPIQLIQLVLSKRASLAEIKRAISDMTGIQSSKIWMGDVWSNKFYKLYESDMVASDMQPNDAIYGYEVEPINQPETNQSNNSSDEPGNQSVSQSKELVAIPVVLHYQADTSTNQSSTFTYSRSSSLHALPRIISLDKNSIVTGRSIHQSINRLMDGWFNPPINPSIDESLTSSAEGVSADDTPNSQSTSTDASTDQSTPTNQSTSTESISQSANQSSDSSRVTSPEPGTDYVMVADPANDEIMNDSDSDHSITQSINQPAKLYRVLAFDSDLHGCLKCGRSQSSEHTEECEIPNDDESINLAIAQPTTSSYSYSSRNNQSTPVIVLDFTADGYARYAREHETPINHPAYQAEIDNPSITNKPSLNLYDCLAAFAKEEILDESDSWYCSKCKHFQKASKTIQLFNSPDCLIVHLKRFEYSRYSREKINVEVAFPMQDLDLSPFITSNQSVDQSVNAPSPIYDLFAVSNHMGGLGGGHYNAYIRNLSNNQWYLHDDSRVSSANTRHIQSSSAYVLFYQRRTEPVNQSVNQSSEQTTDTPMQADVHEQHFAN